MEKKLMALIVAVILLCGSFWVSAQETVTLEFMHTFWVEGAVKVLNSAIDAFEAENPSIKISQTQISWTDAPSQYMTSIVGGKAPDILVCNSGILASLRGIDALADLTDLISDDMLANFTQVAKSIIINEDGRVDALPQEGCNWALFYRKDLFEEAGLDPEKPPKTWDEFIQCAKALTKDTDGDGIIDQWGYGWPAQAENANDYWINFMEMFGGGFDDYDAGSSTYKANLQGEAALAATTAMVGLTQTECVTPSTIVDMDWEAVTNGFVAGNFAMMHNGAWVVSSIHSKGPELDGKWDTALLFDGPVATAYRGHPNTLNITSSSQHKQEAWKFCEYLYSQGTDKSEDGLTWIEQICKACDSLSYTHTYIEWAKNTYSDELIPFVDATDHAIPTPLDPVWMSFSEMFVVPTVQQMLMGDMSVEDGLAYLQQNLEAAQIS